MMPPASLGEIVQQRLRRLSFAAREFLEMLAAVGEPLPESLAIHLARVGPDAPTTVPSTVVSSLLSQNFVRRRESTGEPEIEICHDQIRAAVIATVPEPLRRALHLRIAEALASIEHQDAGMVAVHFAKGGDERRAAEYAMRAAQAAENVLAFDRAAQFWGMALALAACNRPETARLYQHLARAHAASGRGVESARAYEKAAEFAPAGDWQLELRRHAAEEWIRCGNLRQGIALLVTLGSEFQIRYTDSVAVAAVSILWSRAALAWRGLRYRERPAGELPPRDLARLDVYWALLATELVESGDRCKFPASAFALALKAGEPRRIAVALATEAGYQSLAGERAYVKARSLLAEALAIGKRLGDAHITGTGCAMAGMCGYLTGRWDVAVESGLEGERILRENCAGVSWELKVAQHAGLGGLIWSGQWKTFAQRLEEAIRDVQDRGDLNAVAGYRMNRCPISLAADDVEQAAEDLDFAEETMAAAWSGRGFHIPNFFGLFGRAQVALYQGRATAAFDGMHGPLRRLRWSRLIRVETFAIFALLLEGSLAVAAAAESSADGARRRQLLRIASARAGDLRRRRAIWSSGLAMLIEAGVESASGRAEEASARWYDAQQELTRSGMRMYAAAARYCGGVAGADKAAVESAEAFFRAQGVKVPGKLAVVLAPGMCAG